MNRVRIAAKEFSGFLAMGGIAFFVFLIPASILGILADDTGSIAMGWFAICLVVLSLIFGVWGYLLSK